MPTIRVYGADWCAPTRRAIAHLKQKAVDFEYVNIEDNPEAAAWVRSKNNGKELKPTIDIDGRVLSEPSEAELDSALGR